MTLILNLLRLVLWPNICSLLENVPCALEKTVYFVAFGRNDWPNMSLKANVSLLIFCLNDVSTDEIGVLKSLSVIVWLSTSPFRSVKFCFLYSDVSILSA